MRSALLLLLACVGVAAPLGFGVLAGEITGPAPPDGSLVEIIVPRGASSRAIARLLEEAELVGRQRVFHLYARARGAARALKAGRYEMPRGASYPQLLDALIRGRVATSPLTIPEGLRVAQVAERLAAYSGDSLETVLRYLAHPARVTELDLPGPTLEGYLFPETYRFADGVPVTQIVATLARRYHAFWGGEERAAIAALGLDEREAVTLASIVEKEVLWSSEHPLVAGLYWNRLRRGMPLQSDPTVQFALGRHIPRLLFRHIDSVADHPYNTYTHHGLPPGPIASPGASALRAVMAPAEHDFVFMVARRDGRHEFTSTLAEHNAAIRRIRSPASAAANR